MQNDDSRMDGVCRNCGSKEATAAADARALGLLEEFLAGDYSCCQIVQWADEQWLAWQDAGREDGKAFEEVTRPLEIEPDILVPVRVRKRKSPEDPRV
jgi:hypothetical protein